MVEVLSFENDLSRLIDQDIEIDPEIKKYFEFECYKKNHDKEKVFSLSLFNKDVDQQEGEAKDNKNFENKYLKSLKKLIPLINKTYYGINLFCEDRYKNIFNDKNINVYSFRNSYGALGSLWRFLSVDMVEESIICDIDLDDINIHKLFFNQNESCRSLDQGKNNFYVDKEKTSKKYSPIIASHIKLLSSNINFNMKNMILKFLTYQKNNNLSKIERQNIYNKPIGDYRFGFGNNWLNYGIDERFLGKIIYFYLVKKGKLTTIYKNYGNKENTEDLNYCLLYKNKILLL
tara:strand:+ start:602 stop:1468 length:867 start_codon:yes stop_codon:yes gene_type:complete